MTTNSSSNYSSRIQRVADKNQVAELATSTKETTMTLLMKMIVMIMMIMMTKMTIKWLLKKMLM